MFNPYDEQNHAGLLKGMGVSPLLTSRGAAMLPKEATAVIDGALPVGGKDILFSSGLASEKSPEDTKLLAQSLAAPEVQTAIVLQALALYADSILAASSAALGKAQADARDFVTKMKAWPLLTQVYWLAANEIDPPGQLDAVVKLVDQAVSTLSASKAKSDAATLVDAYKAVKAAQIAYWKAQIVQVQFTLSEIRIAGTNTTQTSWFGPVPMRPEVASSAGVYPVSPCYLPQKVGERNPDLYSRIPGLADYLVFSAYPASGATVYNPQTLAALYAEGKKNPAAFDSAWALTLLRDQWTRLTGKPFNDDVNNLVVGTVPSFVDTGLKQDPEWEWWRPVYVEGGGYYLKGPKKPPLVGINVQYQAWYDLLLSDVTQYLRYEQKQARKNQQSALSQAYKAYTDSLVKLRTTIVLICGGVPPVPMTWTASGKLLRPTPDWQAWRAEVQGPASTDLAASGKRFFASMSSFVSFVLESLQACLNQRPPMGDVDALKAWSPTSPTLPWKVTLGDYSRGLARLKQAQPILQTQTQALLNTLTPLQVEWVGARADVKSALLTAARLYELGSLTQQTTDSIISTLAGFAQQLYGAELPDPPSSLSPTKYREWYEKALVEASKNPTPDSLAGQAAALQAEYDKNPSPTILQKIDGLKAAMSRLVARRVRRRGLATDNVLEPGGSLDLSNRSNKALERGTKGPMTDAEKRAADAIKTGNLKTTTRGQQALAYVTGSGAALDNLIKANDLPVSDTVATTIAQNDDKAGGGLPQEKKGGAWLLLALLGGAAYVANNGK